MIVVNMDRFLSLFLFARPNICLYSVGSGWLDYQMGHMESFDMTHGQIGTHVIGNASWREQLCFLIVSA